MKRVLVYAISLLMLFAISGCGAENIDSGADNSRITALEEENKSLKDQLTAALNEKTIAEAHATWVSTDGAWRYEVEMPENRLWLSTDKTDYYLSYGAQPYSVASAAVNTVAITGTVLEAYAAITLYNPDSTENVTWLMVRYPIYSVPGIPVFWVKQSQCVPYTTENQKDARSPITLRSGTVVNDGSNKFLADADILTSYTIIDRIDENIVHISQAGGWTASVTLDDIIYPNPESFTYGNKS